MARLRTWAITGQRRRQHACMTRSPSACMEPGHRQTSPLTRCVLGAAGGFYLNAVAAVAVAIVESKFPKSRYRVLIHLTKIQSSAAVISMGIHKSNSSLGQPIRGIVVHACIKVQPAGLLTEHCPVLLLGLCVQYKHEVGSLQQKLSGLTREELQRALGVKPMDKSSRWAP